MSCSARGCYCVCPWSAQVVVGMKCTVGKVGDLEMLRDISVEQRMGEH